VSLTGVVLAGGESQRFGSEKLEFPVGGQRMLARVIEAMRQAADRVVVSARDTAVARRLAGPAVLGVTWLADRPQLGGAGPAAGMLTALDRERSAEVLFAPGDMPWISAEGLRAVRERGRARAATSVAPVWPDGRTEPLVQWHRAGAWAETLGALPTRGGQGIRPTDLLRGGKAVVLLPVTLLSADPRCFANVNERADLTRASAFPAEGAIPGPIARSPEAGTAFWTAVEFSRTGAVAEASRSFAEEARHHAQTGIHHLELHALEDALRCARAAGLPLDPLEAQLAAVRRTMRA